VLPKISFLHFLKWTFSRFEIIMLVPYAKNVGLVECLLLGQIDVYEKKQGIMYLAPRGSMFHIAQVKYVL
jgi:hypothetical protein